MEDIERAGHGRYRAPVIGDDAIGRPRGVAGGIGGAREPFAHTAGVAVLLAFDAGHQRAHAWREPVIDERLQRLARLVPVARVDGADGHCDLRLGIVRRETREVAHAIEAVARAVARPGVGIGGREIGMRRQAPCLEQDAGGAGCVAARSEHAAGDGSGRNQIGCQPVGFLRQLQGLVGVGILERLGLGRQQHRAAASGGRLFDDVLAARDFERMQCSGPILRAALQLEQRFDWPAQLGIALQRPLGELAGRFVLALALGFEEQAAQTELLGLGRGEHGLEDAPRGGAVAADLGGLRAQQVREGLVRQRLARLGRIADGECAVAGADGDDAAGERIEPALLTAAIEIAAHRCGAAPEPGAGATTPQRQE